MSYQEKLVGNRVYVVFALALLLVALVLAGQYESWYAPATVILALPLSRKRARAAATAQAMSGSPLARHWRATSTIRNGVLCR